MAKADKNSFDGFFGRRGNMVTYLRLGKPVSRSIGKSNKPPTAKQSKYRAQTSIVNDLINSVKGFMQIGFQSEALMQEKTPNDLIQSYTRLNAIKGDYPNQDIDFTRVLFSMGKMPPTSGIQVKLNEDSLEYTWDTTPLPGKFRADDQVMLMAYFPALKNAEYVISGGNRAKGTAQLSLLKNETSTLIETYISFISADHRNVSNSVYTGQFILPAATSINQ